MRLRMLAALMTLSLCLFTAQTRANDTTFTYQGRLTDNGGPANGSYSATFKLYSAASGGSLLGTDTATVQATDGIFSVELDFGTSWNNTDRWLEITVNGSTLSPRQPVTRSPYAITTRGIDVNSDGQVGIGGTATTTNMLTIRDHDPDVLLLSQGNNFGPTLTFRNTSTSFSGTVHGDIIFDDGAQLAAIGYVKPGIGPEGLQFSGAADVNMKITDAGSVGIGTLDPEERLEVVGGIRSSGPVAGVTVRNPNNNDASMGIGWLNDVARIRIGGNGAGAAGGLDIQRTGDASLMRILHNGNVGIGTTNPQTKLEVNGHARVDVLEIIGADLAEKFPTSTTGEIEPGTVLEIDPENPGQLRVASSACSTLVAGVVSGANGLSAGTIMGNLPGSEAHAPVALSGRVWVKCDASSGAIKPGDMLTTSSTPGHAMAVGDMDAARGAIIGKAMTTLDRGERGLVLVLVNLQ
ncbi:MAG: hypothetical protein H6810_11110 [Phycisphaeraceae bacterium]|nr:MAG: hypothetical protein H6810_11110 [Phycisphaeraceae bacterium]